MDQSLLVLLLLTLGLYFWRPAISVMLSMLVAWFVSLTTASNTSYFSYFLLLAGLIFGIAWQIKARIRQRQDALQKN